MTAPTSAAPLAPYQIFNAISPATANDIFAFLFQDEKKLYKASIEALAKQRNLRPVFIERKPRDERFAWLKAALSRHAANHIGAHLLQIWLVGKQGPLLCEFLDALGIEHDEDGTVQELPPAPEKEKLLSAIDAIRSRHDHEVVSVYIHAFQALDDEGGWTTLAELLAEDERLHLPSKAVS